MKKNKAAIFRIPFRLSSHIINHSLRKKKKERERGKDPEYVSVLRRTYLQIEFLNVKGVDKIGRTGGAERFALTVRILCTSREVNSYAKLSFFAPPRGIHSRNLIFEF